VSKAEKDQNNAPDRFVRYPIIIRNLRVLRRRTDNDRKGFGECFL
jgi:hypothetical protein